MSAFLERCLTLILCWRDAELKDFNERTGPDCTYIRDIASRKSIGLY